MNIQIKHDKTIQQIQQQFQSLFPYLKIEFYKKMHADGEGSSMTNMLQHQIKLGEIDTVKEEGKLFLSLKMKVKELEHVFAEQFGLFIQVFRKSGQIWLQTVKTDDWSLEKQNLEGQEMSHGPAPEEPVDYHDQD